VSQNNLENLNLLREKLKYFQQEKDTTADPSRQFELKQKIKETQQEIENLEKSHRKKCNLTFDKELEIALWSLNHSEQFTYFQLLAQNFHNIVGIRIQIPPSSHIPLTWLLRCLVKNLVKNEDDIIYSLLSFFFAACGSSIFLFCTAIYSSRQALGFVKWLLYIAAGV
jgi:hypothetical protein